MHFNWVIFDGSHLLDLNFPFIDGDYKFYCPIMKPSYEEFLYQNDFGEVFDGDFREHCSNWHEYDLFGVSGAGSLTLENVYFNQIRSQYRTLIHMDNSSNLTMLNTHFEKFQSKPTHEWGVVTIKFDENTSCPETGCNPIVFNGGSVKFLNYGYTYTETIQLSSFLWVRAEQVSLVIENVSFE